MYARKKHGRGFTYRYPSGETVRDKGLKKWFKSLAIPPAWTEVKISSSKEEKVLASGRDAKGRKQYIYNPTYQEKRKQAKFDRIIRFAERLTPMRRVTGQHLREPKMTRKKVCAAMLRLMDEAYFRPGNRRYTKENGSYGLTTIRSKHLSFEGNAIIFDYVGKSGKVQHKTVKNPRLSEVVKQLDEMPGYRVFQYLDEAGEKQTVESADLNAYIQEVMGDDFSAKDFRTWAGTVVAAITLDKLGAVQETDQTQLDENIKEAISRAAEMLGNTPAVARSSYIDPRVIEHYINGQTVRFFSQQAKQLLKSAEDLEESEQLVLCMLKQQTNN